MVDAETVQATLDDPAAKAWRLAVAGVGERAGDRWEILVETGDVGPAITATEIRDGRVVDVMDLSGFADGTAAAGGCHGTLPVCLSSDGFRLPQDGDGRFSVRLVLPEPGTPLTLTGATATWPGEPFVLGPWTRHGAVPLGRQQLTPGARRRRDVCEGVLVGRGRIELPQPKARVLQTLGLTTCPTDPRMVEMRGLEPLASAMRTRRSPS